MKNTPENSNLDIPKIHSTEKIISYIKANFSEIAKNLISENLDISNEQNKSFLFIIISIPHRFF